MDTEPTIQVDLNKSVNSEHPYGKIDHKVLKIKSSLIFDTLKLNRSTETAFKTFFLFFFFVGYLSQIGVIPLFFLLTAQLSANTLITTSLFTALLITMYEKYKEESLSVLIPADSNPLLGILLIPIEFLSYISKPISLAVRLFINLMAGHSLLKVIVGFGWDLIGVPAFIYKVLKTVPLISVSFLYGLETGVAAVQAYVFFTLSVLQINDIKNKNCIT